MAIHCNGGTARTNLAGRLPGLDNETIWFHRNGIANVISLALVKEHFRVTFDSAAGNTFVVHKPDGSTIEFQQSDRGLYYYDADRSTGATAQS